jgi:D-tyrosyl-tRNA(Tyr) deacylase
MFALVQRVTEGSVRVKNKFIGSVSKGYVVFIGVCKNDKASDAIKLAQKIVGLRVFEDAEGKMNLSIQDIEGSILAVSQFTLCADITKGRRPSFENAMEPVEAEKLFTVFVEMLRAKGVRVETGAFGEYMFVKILNDGPVTIWIDSKAKRSK